MDNPTFQDRLDHSIHFWNTIRKYKPQDMRSEELTEELLPTENFNLTDMS